VRSSMVGRWVLRNGQIVQHSFVSIQVTKIVGCTNGCSAKEECSESMRLVGGLTVFRPAARLQFLAGA
jgi:hypothetical protein